MRTSLLLLVALLSMSECMAQSCINGICGQSIFIPVYSPTIVQKTHASTGSTAKTLVTTFSANTTPGNTIIVSCGGSNYASSNWSAAVTDSQVNTFSQDVIATESTTQFAALFHSINTIGSTADAITLTISGSSSANESLGCEIYEVLGNFSPSTPLDQTNTGSNSGSTSPSAGSLTPIQAGEYAFVSIASGATSTPTVSAGTTQPWILDSTTSVSSGSLTFGAESLSLTANPSSITGNATLSASNAWAAAMATYKIFLPAVQVNALVPRNLIVPASVTSTSSSYATLVAAGPTGVYLDLGWLSCSNSGSTATEVSVNDNAGSGGTTYNFDIANQQGAYGGLGPPKDTPIPQTNSATAWDIENSAATTIHCVGTFLKRQ